MAFGDNVCLEFFSPGEDTTGKCSATVRGKRLVSLSSTPTGGMTGTENVNIKECAGATEAPIGVARYEGASGDQIPIISGGNRWLPLVVGAAVTFGQPLMSDSQGRVIPYVGPITTNAAALPTLPVMVGVALETNAVVDSDVGVRMAI